MIYIFFYKDFSVLFDDLVECWFRRRGISKNLNQDLQWPAVLTDVILGFLSYPVHMFRSIVRPTFQQMIYFKVWSKYTIDSLNCVQFIEDIMKTRSANYGGRKKISDAKNDLVMEVDYSENDDDSSNEELELDHNVGQFFLL